MRVKSANKSFYKTYLTSESETEGKLIYELADKQWDIPPLQELMEKILPEKKNFVGYEVELNFPGLGTRTLIFNGREMQTENGAENLILLAIDDLTEIRLANTKIEESEERYHNLIYTSPSAIGILKGEDLVITVGNDAIIEIWGKGREIMGKRYFEALPELAEQGYKEIFSEVYKTGKPFSTVETPVSIVQNGKVELKFYNFLLFAQRNISDEIEGIGIIATEVTFQALLNKKIQESQAQFSAMADNIPQLAWMANADGSIYWYNKKWLNYTGYTFEELRDIGWENAIHPEDFNNFSETWICSLATGVDFELELRLKDRNGKYYWHLSRSVAVRDTEGKISKWISNTTQIQKQKEIREELEIKVNLRTLELLDKNKELEKMNKELESFTYISSHDLQEPLRKIRTFAGHILEMDEANLSDTGKDYFRRMQLASQRMQNLIKDLLKFSRTSTGERIFEMTDLAKIIQQVKNDFKEEIREKQAIVEVGDLCTINVIVYQINQLIANLISNALKFSKPEITPQIFIDSEFIKGNESEDQRLTLDAQYCHLRVRDNGIGFDQKYSDRVFEVFQRLHGKDKFPGTGIGLAIVKKIVENHNGFIAAKAVLGEGVTFHIYLPTS